MHKLRGEILMTEINYNKLIRKDLSSYNNVIV